MSESQDTYTSEHREAMTAIVSGLAGQVVSGVAAARKLEPKQVE